MDRQSLPTHTIEIAKQQLSAHVAEVHGQHKSGLNKLRRARQDILLEHLKPHEAELKRINAEERALRKAMAHRNVSQWLDRRRLSSPGVQLDSARLFVKGPPYDFAWTSGLGQGSEAVDPNAGTYSLDVQSLGDQGLFAGAGFGFWFFSQDGNPAQRFAAVFDYFDDWWDDASGYVAHNNGRTNVWVFGASENRWVSQSTGSPSWSDGVGWFESHGNDEQGGDSAVVSNETFFNAQPGSWYQCWMWSSASVYADSGIWGFADSTIHIRTSVPFAVLGGL